MEREVMIYAGRTLQMNHFNDPKFELNREIIRKEFFLKGIII